jgi:hypothetical protein
MSVFALKGMVLAVLILIISLIILPIINQNNSYTEGMV